MNRSKYWAALAALALLLSGLACGEEEPVMGPVLPIAQWVKVDRFACPEDADTSELCSDLVSGDTVTAGRVYIQEFVFTNAEYLFGILSWPLDDVLAVARMFGRYRLSFGERRAGDL